MELYLTIVKAFLNRSVYEKYHDTVDYEFLRQNFPDVLRLFQALDYLYGRVENAEREEFNLVSLQAALQTCFPRLDGAVIQALGAALEATVATTEDVLPLLASLRDRALVSKISFAGLDFAEGKISRDTFNSQTASLLDELAKPVQQEQIEPFVSDELEYLYQSAVAEGGLSWRLRSLNRSLGPLRQGDFGFIFARPETGKTTFLASEVTYMAHQLEPDQPCLWINNEEQHEKVLLRCYEAALGVPLATLTQDRQKAQQAYYEYTRRNIHFPKDHADTWRDIDRLAKTYKPKLIVIDQLDKVKGFDADREDLRMGAIYRWARELSKRYCPVIGVSQSDGSGEGIKYLSMGNVANAKTAKQAEADWILGIGRAHEDMEHVRGFSICKNKLIGGPESVPNKRHGRWDVLIQPEIGRYRDMAS